MKKLDTLRIITMGLIATICWLITWPKLPIYCKECEEPNKPKSKSCSRCGNPLD